jgi:hypothetical protein
VFVGSCVAAHHPDAALSTETFSSAQSIEVYPGLLGCLEQSDAIFYLHSLAFRQEGYFMNAHCVFSYMYVVAV